MTDGDIREPTDELTKRTYWDVVHEAEGRGRIVADQRSPWRRVKDATKRRLGSQRMASIGNYDDFLLWEAILPKYLGGRAGQALVEIGSAPGDFLVRVSRRFGVEPHGVEYSPVGAELNRAAFVEAGLDPSRVIEEDFFAPGLRERYAGAFDVAISRGFIEHFANPTDAIRRHLDLLRVGGLLIISIPNLRGANFLLSWLFDRKVLAMHNLAIMTRERFAQLFASEPVEPLWCAYYGTFNFQLVNARPDAPLRPILVGAWRCQPVLNTIFHTVMGRRPLESGWSSPNLIFVGVKR